MLTSNANLTSQFQAENQPFTAWQVEQLATPPARDCYRRLPDGTYYLPIGYYRETADRIFGSGNWAICYDPSSLRFESQLNPLTGKSLGLFCYIAATLTLRDCLPLTVVGHAPVKVGTTATALDLSLAQYELALRQAEATALKKALAHYGVAFVCNPQAEVRVTNPVALPETNRRKSGKSPIEQPVVTPPAQLSLVKPPTPAESELLTTSEPPAPWESSNSVSAVIATPSEVETEAKLTAEQLTAIEQLVSAKGYPMKAADGTAEKLFGVPVKDLSSSQADEMLGKLEKLKTRQAA